MSMKVLFESVKDIEEALEKFEKKELTYKDTHRMLVTYGYSEKEASSILAHSMKK